MYSRIIIIIAIVATFISAFFSLQTFLELSGLTFLLLLGLWKEVVRGVDIPNAELNKMVVKVQYETGITDKWDIIKEVCFKAYKNDRVDWWIRYSDEIFYKSILKVIWGIEKNRDKWYYKLKSEEYWKALAQIEEEIYYLDCMK